MLTKFASETQITHLGRLWLYFLSALVLIYLILPVMIVIPISFSDSRFLRFPPDEWSLRWYRSFFESREWLGAAWVSLRVAVLTTLVATPLGVAAAYGLKRAGILGGRIVTLALISPLIVPIIIIAIGIFYLYARLGIVNTLPGLVLAHSVLAIPFVIVTATSGLQQFDDNLERAARSLGASRWTAFHSITLPQLKGSVLSGSMFAFITSLDEVVISIFVSGGSNTTLTKRMFTGLRDEVDPTIAAISSMLIVISVVMLSILVLFSGKRSA